MNHISIYFIVILYDSYSACMCIVHVHTQHINHDIAHVFIFRHIIFLLHILRSSAIIAAAAVHSWREYIHFENIFLMK